VYQGAPTTVTAFMSTIVKTAAFAGFIRLFSPYVFGPDNFNSMTMFLIVCVLLTLAIGNLTAAVQTSVKRMLAYSSVAHAGFLLMAVIAKNPVSIEYYAAAYSIASIAAFTVLLAVVNYAGGDSVDHFNGLGKRSPLLAITMAIALLSLAGIPPTAGFFAKYYVFNAMIGAGHPWLVVFAVLTSLVGVYYYFRIIIAMFFREPVQESSPKVSEPHQALLFFAALAVIALGLMPDLILNLKLKMMPVVATVLPH
jgi:NADH-quinone oxidoreductase subunit N